jgi:hypothetical protein
MTSPFFTAIPEAQGILHSGGVYRQVALFQRKGQVYARYGAGFVRLSQGGSTSAPKVRWAEGLYAPEGTFKEGGAFVEYTPPGGSGQIGVAAE